MVKFVVFVAIVGVISASPLLSSVNSYAVVPLTWHGINQTDGSEVTIIGTIQGNLQHVRLLDESVKWTMPPVRRLIAPRSKNKNIVCWQGGNGLANNYFLQQGIDYLKGITDRPCTASPGPKVCTRISCSDGAGIWLCNDTPVEIHYSCPDLATYAEDIRAKCHTEGKEILVRGKEYDTLNFHVDVGGDDC
ncbi:hypothetical protein F5Y04DRAFT_284995 [Hypomontagnella monticulosa]|nr:hypothetical protein F5Y04DRAFT_284995 [Hypomontagnella monticulosa]